jgi:iron complex outermembrane receptor protein
MMRRALLALLLCCITAPGLAASNTLAPLTAADIPALVKPPAHGERIIALWALDCAYCEPNLSALAKLQRAHPHQIKLVTVATDDIASQRTAVENRLKAMHMTGYPARAYAAAAPERLNYLVDPDWGGETPRTLVIRADGSRIAISGELTPQQLRRTIGQQHW